MAVKLFPTANCHRKDVIDGPCVSLGGHQTEGPLPKIANSSENIRRSLSKESQTDTIFLDLNFKLRAPQKACQGPRIFEIFILIQGTVCALR